MSKQGNAWSTSAEHVTNSAFGKLHVCSEGLNQDWPEEGVPRGKTSTAVDRGNSLILGLVALEEPGVLRAVGEVLQLFTSFLLNASHLIECNILRAELCLLLLYPPQLQGK